MLLQSEAGWKLFIFNHWDPKGPEWGVLPSLSGEFDYIFSLFHSKVGKNKGGKRGRKIYFLKFLFAITQSFFIVQQCFSTQNSQNFKENNIFLKFFS